MSQRRPLPSAAAVLVSVLALVAACAPGLARPVVTAGGTLELAVTPPPSAPQGVFAVAYAAPRGETRGASEATLVFNRPMRPLELVGDESNPPARIVVRGTGATPAGSWRWMGTSGLAFAPAASLPNATEYVMTVPAGTRALSGETLATAFEDVFSTPRPQIDRIDPGDGDHQLVPAQAFEVRFDQAVDPREVERAATLTVGEGAASHRFAFHASRPDPQNAKLVRIAPAAPLSLASKVTLAFDASLRGTEGPLPMGAVRTFEMATYGPVAVRQIRCWNEPPGRCRPGASFEVELSNRVSFKELRSHVRITPYADISWSKTRADTTIADSYAVPATLRAGTHYRVTIEAGLRDEHGQVLAHDVDVPFDIDDLDPSVVVGMSGTVFEAGTAKARSVPVVAVNTPAYAVATGALDERAVADLVAPRQGSSERPEQIFARVSAWPGVHVDRVTPGGGRNVSTSRRIDVEPLLAATGGHGAFFIATERELRIGNVTDLAITAKMSRFGSLVWVTRLSNGQPVSGANVAIGDRTGRLYETRTDADGIAAIPATSYAPADVEGAIDDQRVVFARLGDDWTWRQVGDASRWAGNGVYVDPSGGLEPQGMLFTDRGVYRPGETVELETMFRVPQPRGTETPAGRQIAIEAVDALGESMFDGTATLDEFGVATLKVPLPATAHLGTASIQAKIDGAGRSASTTSVLLAAYKASEFKVGVDAAAPAWVRGGEATFDVRGDYLFGAPMAGAKVHWSVTRARGWFTPPGHEAFAVDDEAYEEGLPERSPRALHVQSGDGTLDAHGTFAARIPLTGDGQQGTEIVTLEAEVQDVSRQTTSSRASALVHPGSFDVALRRPTDWFAATGAALRVEAAAVEPTGRRRAGVPVHVDLVRRTWSNVLESTGESSGHWEAHAVDAVVAKCEVTSAPEPVACSLMPTLPGFYIVRARAKDEKGREVAASYDVYVVGEGGDAGWAANDSNELSLVPDKKSYEVGDVAKILVKSPFRDADALVTVERAGIYRQERLHLAGATPTITVPVTDDLRPNAYVAVHLVRGRTKAPPAHGADVGAPAFKSGYARLSIDPESRRLKVALTPAKKELRPGDTVDADIVVTAAGKPAEAELTLWAVDEGVLMLTGYQTPDPLPTFTAPRSLAVFGMESRADLARIFRASFAELGVDKGDEGGGGGTAMRADFRATAWFQPGVKTGADGRAHVRFKLPDNLTTFRLMAVAVAKDDRFGDGEAQVTTSRPLMLRPALPRFLRAGDTIDAGVVVSNKGMPDARVEIAASVEGAVVGAEAKRVVTVKSGESVEVRWPIQAPRAGKAAFSFRARAGVESDAVQVTKEVEAPSAMETVALAGETSEAAAEKLGDLGTVRDDVGQLDVRVASTALVGVGDGMDQLLEYPYGCTEQLTSRLVPLVAARDLAKALGIALPKDPDGLADAAIAKILANQQSDGGFGWWPDSRHADPWVTAYALWGLDVARRGGRPVPDDAVNRAVEWLRGRLSGLERASAVDLAGRAMVVDVLATIGKPDPGFTNRLYERRADMPLFARALLAHAIAMAKMDPSQGEELLRDLDQHLRVTPESASVVDNLGDDYAPVLDSQPRTTAMVLRALVAMNPKHALAPRLARGLLGERVNGQWQSTHEAAWALLALDDYRRAFEQGTPKFEARVWVGTDLALAAPFGAGSPLHRETSVPTARLLAQPDRSLTFQVGGTGSLFYEARLRYARKEPPRDTIDRGFFVRKMMRSVTADGLRDALQTLPAQTQARVRAGDLVLVDLTAVTPWPREQVVIDDPLPAGLEPVDASLATTAESLDVTDAGGQGDADDAEQTDDDARASGRGWTQAWFHREMHDDRVLTFVEHMPAGVYHYRYLARATTAGTFVVPPTRAECMYDPAVFGRTAASQFVVAP